MVRMTILVYVGVHAPGLLACMSESPSFSTSVNQPMVAFRASPEQANADPGLRISQRTHPSDGCPYWPL